MRTVEIDRETVELVRKYKINVNDAVKSLLEELRRKFS